MTTAAGQVDARLLSPVDIHLALAHHGAKISQAKGDATSTFHENPCGSATANRPRDPFSRRPLLRNSSASSTTASSVVLRSHGKLDLEVDLISLITTSLHLPDHVRYRAHRLRHSLLSLSSGSGSRVTRQLIDQHLAIQQIHSSMTVS